VKTDESIDALDFFFRLDEKKKPKPTEDEKHYPGNTPPRNTERSVDSAESDWLTSLPYQEFLVSGEKRRFYTIGALARVLGKQPVTIRSWESKGWLPTASFRTPAPKSAQIPGKAVKGKRLYSQAQVVFLAEAYDKYVLTPRKPNWQGFRHHIKTQYPR